MLNKKSIYPIIIMIEMHKKKKEVGIMCKKILSFIVVLCLVFAVMPVTVSAAGVFESGSGTAIDPYVIATTSQLNKIRNYSGSHFVLGNDIEFTEEDFSENGDFYNDGYGWIPIENFSGSLDGNGFTIAYLYSYVESQNIAYAGLIAENDGTVSNLTIYECYVVADSVKEAYAGSIAAINNGTITQCYSHGYVYAVEARYSYAGGICAENTGTVSICMNYAMVDSEGGDFANNYFSGGIVGLNTFEGILTYCYNYGYIYGKTAGGIAGHSDGAYILICQNDGYINKLTENYEFLCSGGIVGKTDNESVVQCCINTMNVSASASADNAIAGGIVGHNVNSQIADCYNNANIFATAHSAETQYLYSGGIVGVNSCDETLEFYNESISCVYNIGKVKTTIVSNYNKTRRGNIAGDTDSHVKNAYYEKNDAYGIGLYNSEFESDTICLGYGDAQKSESYKGFDFNEMWWLHTESYYNYPQLTLISEKPATSISIMGDTNTIFYVGTEPDFSGGTMIVRFENGKSLQLDASKLIYITEPDINKIGEQTIYAIYAGHTFQFRITYIKEKPDSIVISTMPRKLNYVQGQELELKDLSVKAVYDDFLMWTDSRELVISYDKEATGEVEVTVTYQDVSTSFMINVVPDVLSHIKPISPYVMLDKTGNMSIVNRALIDRCYGTLDNYYTKTYTINPSMLSGYDINKKGKQTATITYQGKTTSIDIYVIDDKPGDVNGDSQVNTVDLATMKLFLAGFENVEIERYPNCADCNCDFRIDTEDLAVLKLELAGIK